MNRDDGVQKRLPIPNKTIITVQEECRKTNDDIRWLVGMISDTGLRLSEATGLAIDDIVSIVKNEKIRLIIIIDGFFSDKLYKPPHFQKPVFPRPRFSADVFARDTTRENCTYLT